MYVLYRTSGNTDRSIVLYEYQLSQGGVHLETVLKEFKGCFCIDDYARYHNLTEEIMVVGTWAHVRRKFDEAMKSLPKGRVKGSAAFLCGSIPNFV